MMKNPQLLNPLHIKLSKDGHGEFPDTYILTGIGMNRLKEEFKELLQEAYSNAQTTMITTEEETYYHSGCEALKNELLKLIEEL